MSYPANLEFFDAETLERINIADLGNEYKNSNDNLMKIIIANTGGRDAINVKAKFIPANVNGEVDGISYNWKTLSYDENDIFKPEIDLPDIPMGRFMPGYNVESEDFNNYIGKDLSQDWISNGVWEVYSLLDPITRTRNSYLQHLVEDEFAVTGRATPMHFSNVRNCDLSVDIAIQQGNFGGVMLRCDETGFGYWIIVYPDKLTIEKVNNYYLDLIPNFTPIDPKYEGVIGIGKGYASELDLDPKDFAKLYKKAKYWFPVGTGAMGLERDTLNVILRENVIKVNFNGEEIGRWADPDPIESNGRMSLIAGNKYGSVVIFDDIRYKMETDRGTLFVKSAVPSSPEPSLKDDNIYYSRLLIEYSD